MASARRANDRLVGRRQKRKGVQWSIETADALAALRTLLLNERLGGALAQPAAIFLGDVTPTLLDP
jgi:hypothetical protein